uniref:ATP synthase F0 subunit 8 n=1 Tax=Malaccina discoidalis TaxID=3035031 RepID=UPI00279B1EE0|nr:ATP synthase F0 subunit 8 [Malaccina discoidalis]WGO57395.1 ATP synthase F0 subunit 8 [Malaccina discoidalis]
MPQMMPLNWLSLYFFFCLILMMFNFMNYFSFIPTYNKHSMKLNNNKSLNWKW